MIHLQQVTSALLLLFFGILALAIWKEASARDEPAAGWGVAGSCFVAVGTSSLLHALAAFAAVQRGPGSMVYRLTMEWAMAANVGRAAVTLSLPVLLVVAMSRSRRIVGRPVGTVLPLLAVLALILTAAAQPLQTGSYHQAMTTMAVMSTILAVALMGVLLLALVMDALDRLLWAGLALFALKEVLNVSLFAILAWWSASPDPLAVRVFYWLMLSTTVAMNGIALHRLSLARAGARVPAPFQLGGTLRRSATA